MSQTGTYDLTVIATGIVSGRRVVACSQPADAACPVYLHEGATRRTQIGQAADWRHSVEAAAAQYDAECVTGYYHDGGWHVITTADEVRVAAIVRERKAAEAAREAAEARREKEAREQAERREVAARLAARTQQQIDADDAVAAARRIRPAARVASVHHVTRTDGGLRCVVEVRYADGTGYGIPFGALDGQRIGVVALPAA